MKTQKQEILEALKRGERVTQSYAIKRFRCFRLAARICDLRADGHKVLMETVAHKSKRTGRIVRNAAYYMEG